MGHSTRTCGHYYSTTEPARIGTNPNRSKSILLYILVQYGVLLYCTCTVNKYQIKSIKSIKHTHHGDGIRRSRSSHAHGCLEVDHTLHRHRTSVHNVFSMCRRQRRLAHHRRNMEAYQSVHDHVRRTQGFMSTGFSFSGMGTRCCS